MRTTATRWAAVETPIGLLTVVADEDAIVAVSFPTHRGKAVPSQEPNRGNDPSPLLQRAIAQLAEYFAGARQTFELPLRPAGTVFQQQVWGELRKIPFGQTINYGELARRIGNPAASRAVGAANGQNPIGILIPCHRVIGVNGSLTGFGGGVEAKRVLLDLERPPGAQLFR